MKYEDLPQHFPEIYAESAPKIEGAIHPCEYKHFFDSLSLLNNSSLIPKAINSLISHSNTEEIPKVLHYIWLGGHLPVKYFEDISFFANQMKKISGITLLWTDRQNVDPKQREWLEQNSLYLIPIASVFSNPKMMSTYYHFRASLNAIPSNYGEASDLLRYEILHYFGGYYLDCDVKMSDIDFPSLTLKGANPIFGFVCGYSSYPRNDIVGSMPGSLLMSNLKKAASSNYYQQAWKKRGPCRDRPLMNYITVLTTGPSVFEEVINKTIEQLILSGKCNLPNDHCHPYVEVHSNNSDESWVIYRPMLKNRKKKDNADQINHDLCSSLICEPEILDLHKYLPNHDFNFTVTIKNLIDMHPILFQKINRIFTGEVYLYQEIQKIIETTFSKPIDWNEFATLKVACLMELEEMVKFLVLNKSVKPFRQNSYANVGHYDCPHASPLLLAIEQGHLRIVELLLKSIENFDEVKSCLHASIPDLFYTGIRDFGFNQNSFWIPGYKIQKLLNEKSASTNCLEIEQKIEDYRQIEQLIQKYKKN